MPNEFIVVGENRDDLTELLVLGTDGRYYEYNPAHERLSPTDPDEHWDMFPSVDELEAQSP